MHLHEYFIYLQLWIYPMSENPLKFLTELNCLLLIHPSHTNGTSPWLLEIKSYFKPSTCPYKNGKPGWRLWIFTLCGKVCNSGGGRKQIKLVLSFSGSLLSLVQYRYNGLAAGVNYKFQRAHRGHSWVLPGNQRCRNVQGISQCTHNLRVGDREFISIRYVSKPNWLKIYIFNSYLLSSWKLTQYIKGVDLVMK